MNSKTFLAQPTLFWVEIGRKIPRYARRNMVLHSQLHPDLRQFLVTDKEIYLLSRGQSKFISKLDHTSELERFHRIQKNIESPQKSFWVNTTSRFFYLKAATFQLGIEEFLHLESDVILLNLDSVARLFQNQQISKIGYPLETPTLGCASVFIVRDQGVFSEFLNFVLDSWRKLETTDMTLLGDFAMYKPEYVEVLPTWIRNRSFGDKDFFDAGTFGKFYLGNDARNYSVPLSKRGSKQNSYALVDDLNEIGINRWCVNSNDMNAGNSKGLSIELDGFRLANIHIHSKRIPRKSRLLKKYLKKGFEGNQSNLWKMGRIDGAVFCERLAGAIIRRIGIDVKKHISFR